MLKNKVFKYLVIGSVIFTVVGASMITYGFSQGGSKESLKVSKKNAAWWPFDDVEVGVVNFGVGFIEKEDDFFDEQEVDEEDILEHKNKNVEAIDVTNYVYVHNKNSALTILSGNENSIHYLGETSKIQFEQASDGTHIYVNTDAVITLVNNSLANVIIFNETGTVEVEKLICKSLHYTGNVANVDLEANVDEVKIMANGGKCDFSGIVNKKGIIEQKRGQLDISLIGSEADYDVSVKNLNGPSEINEQYYATSVDEKLGNVQGDAKIDVLQHQGKLEVEIELD